MKRVIDFSLFSSIKIGNRVEVEVIEERISKEDRFIIGGANNLLLSPTPPKIAILSKKFDYIKEEDGFLKIGGATKSGRIFSYCKKHNIGGFEYLGKLPGTLGGLLKMNAGMKSYEISNHLKNILFFDGYKETKELGFGYRSSKIDDIVYEGIFEIKRGFDDSLLKEFQKMRANQPKEPSAGSVFKNPKGDYAGRLIEAVGLKGVKKGDACFSPIHANFLVNMGKATFDDAIFLINEAKKRVFEEFGIKLQEEIIILKN